MAMAILIGNKQAEDTREFLAGEVLRALPIEQRCKFLRQIHDAREEEARIAVGRLQLN